MAQRAVRDKAIPIRLACEAFRVSESCYRYQAKNNAENEIIAALHHKRGTKVFIKLVFSTNFFNRGNTNVPSRFYPRSA